MKQTEFSKKLAEQGLVDARAAVVFGRAKSDLGYGLCLACVNGNTLRIVESDYSQRIGSVLQEFPLGKIQVEKASSFALRPQLRFTYEGQRVLLTGFNCPKEFIEIIREENRK